jgi:hypothetical protein
MGDFLYLCGMRNKVTELFANLTDDQLKEAILQMKEDEPLGIIRIDGWVRKINQEVCNITGETNIATHLFLTQLTLFREFAFRNVT